MSKMYVPLLGSLIARGRSSCVILTGSFIIKKMAELDV